MKKLLVLLLALALVFAFAACNKTSTGEDVATDAEGNVIEAETTPTDLQPGEGDEEYTPDPAETAENETYITDYAEAAARLGLPAVNFPEEMKIFRVLLVDEDKVQVEFDFNEKRYLGQYIVGLADNPSGLKGLYENVETVELSGLSVNFEYPTVDPDNPPDSSQAGSKQLALAQVYDAEGNITAWLVDNDFRDLEDFKAVTELFLNALD